MQRLYRGGCAWPAHGAPAFDAPNSVTQSPPAATAPQDPADDDDALAPPCVMTFNASDPSGAGGLAADIGAISSVGGHALAVVTGAYARDSAEIFDHFPFDDEAVAEQARAVLEDVTVQVIKVGFAGTPEALGAIAQVASDYADVPVVAYMPDLSWWEEDRIDQYQDAFRELLLPQATVLVGNHSTLWRWLLPDWSTERSPTARDLAQAAADSGVSYVLVTGIALPDQFIENVLASPQTVLASEKFERFDAVFAGAGDTLSAALAALLASGSDIAAATTEALGYLDRCLDGGFRPGMGNIVPDRMFWAQPESGTEAGDDGAEATPTLAGFGLPAHDVKH